MQLKFSKKVWTMHPFQNKINEPELRKDFSKFYRRMRNKWYFRNELILQVCKVLCFLTKSLWKRPNEHPAL